MKTTHLASCLALAFALTASAQQQAPAPPTSPQAVKPAPAIPGNAPHATDLRSARQAAEAWIALLDGGSFDQAYVQMGPIARSHIAQADWRNQMKQARQESGPLASRVFQNINYSTTLKNAPAGEYVLMQYLCTFTNGDTAMETIVLMKNGAGWQVAGFSVG